MEIVVLLVLGILTLALIGLVTVIRWITKASRTTPSSRPAATCPSCGGATIVDGRCRNCGWALWSAQPAVRTDELAITTKQLRRLHNIGLLDDDSFTKTMQAITASREQTPVATPPPAPKPVPTPPPSEPLPVIQPLAPIPKLTLASAPVTLPPPRHVAPRPTPPPPPTPVVPIPSEPRKSMTELLARFMEESNIRWGELIGGLLIVGCSIALVFTFWGWIESRPWVKFFLFTAVTAAVFLAGIYTERRWKLPHTSKGLLLIATLLVPLNFLAIAAFSQGMGATNPTRVGGELVAICLFAWLVRTAGKVLVPDWASLFAIAVLGAAASQGIVHRLALPSSQATAAMTMLLAAIPIAFFCLTNAAVLASLWRRPQMDQEPASQLLRFLGTTAFAVILPLGLLAYMTGNASWLMQRTAPLFCIAGLPALGCGLLMWRRLTDPNLSGFRLTGTTIGVIGALILLGGMAMAWPNPAGLLPVAIIDFAALTAVALIFEIPAAHLLALACAIVAYSLGFHLILPASSPAHIGWWDNSPRLIHAVTSPQSAGALVGCFGLLAGAAELWRRAGRRSDGSYYALVGAAVAAISMSLAAWHGLWRADDHGATWIFAIYALAGYAIAWKLAKPRLTHLGSALLAIALVQGVAFRFHVGPTLAQGIAVALFIHASATALAARFARPWRLDLSFAAVCTSVAGLAAVLVNMPHVQTGPVAMVAAEVLWVAAIWLVLAIINRWPAMFTAFQAVLTAGVAFAVLAGLQRHEWFTASRHPLTEPWTLQAIGIAWAALSVAWVGIRKLLPGQPKLLDDAVTLDRWVTGAVLTVLVGLTACAVWPGVEAELSTKPISVVAHPQAWAIGAWALLAMVVLALAAGIWERFNRWATLGVVLALACACPLIAARWTEQTASASALRWSAAGFLILLSMPTWIWGKPSSQTWLDVRTLVLALTVPFVLMLTLVPASELLAGQKIVGPAAGSFFARIGDAGSYLPPLIAVIAALVVYALRERSPGFAFAGSLVLNLTVTLGYLLALVTADVKFETVHLVKLVQFNAIAAAGFALGWIAIRRGVVDSMLQHAQGFIAPLLLVCLLVPAELALVGGTPIPGAGGAWGWLAWAMAGTVVVWMGCEALTAVAVGLLVVGSMAALSVCQATGNHWIAQHALLATRVAAAGLALGFGLLRAGREDKGSVTRWATIFGTLALALAIRAAIDDPSRPTWAVGGMLAVSLLAVALAFWTSGKAWFYPAGLLLNVAASLWWIMKGGVASPVPIAGLIQVNIIVMGLAGVGLLLLELGLLRPMNDETVSQGLSYHRFAARAAAVLMMLSAGWVLMNRGTPRWDLMWIAMTAAWAVMIACLWDVDAGFVIHGIYWLGLALLAVAMAAVAWPFQDVLSYGSVILAGYGVVIGYLFTMRASLVNLATELGIPRREEWPAQTPGWIAHVMLAQAAIVMLLAVGTVLDRSELAVRLAAGTGAIAAAVGVGLLAKDQASGWLHRAALLLGVVGAVLWGWAWLTPGEAGELLNRVVVVMVVTTAMTVFYAIGMVKLIGENAWTEAARGLVAVVGAAVVASLVLVLGVEILQADAYGTEMASWGIVAVLATLLAIGAAAIVCAVVPGRDPLELSERGRTAYVYAAEVLLALVFLHLRLNFPEIFARGIFLRYWPFIVMGIAFAGVGLSELFHRQGRMVLAEPLEKTGAFLPLLPVLAYWAMPKAIAFNGLGGDFTYANLLFIAGFVYAGLAMTRKSVGFGAMAALMANGGLWAVWGNVQGLAFLQHPQLWLVPAAVSVLAAAHLNREKIEEQKLQAVRYLALMAIYVSSTADIWINGVRDNPWLPLVLAVLAVGGVMLGILLRVQSFLFLGTLFLVVAISSMIHYAAVTVGSNWPWMVAGIVLGIGIVGMFGLFEKKRQEMLGLVEGLRKWEK